MTLINEHHIFIFLIQIFLLLGFARGMGELFRRWKQPALTAEILVGMIFGPTILGRFFPVFHKMLFPPNIIQQAMLETAAWWGILFLLMVIGLEIDFSSAWRQRGDALIIAVTDILVPFAISFGLCFLIPDTFMPDPSRKTVFCLFIATVMTVSELSITARILHDLDLFKTDVGFLIMSALSVNDIIGWAIFALVLGVVTNVGVEITQSFTVLCLTMLFGAFCLGTGRHITGKMIATIKRLKMPDPAASLTFICLLGLLCGMITQRIGIQPLFGFFLAGMMAGEAKELSEKTRQIITQMVFALFVPIFFASIALKFDFIRYFDLFLVLFITVIGISARFLGAWLGVTFSKQARANRMLIAIAHTPGGVISIVVGLIALKYLLIKETVFIAIICSVLISSCIAGPWMKYCLKRRKEISILEFFSKRAIIAELKSRNRDDALYELCEKLTDHDTLPSTDTMYEAVLEREHTMGTALEEGIAVPHARLGSLIKPIIVFGRSSSGIEWNSPDGKPAQYIFLILTPTHDDWQVQILTLIARIMSIPSTRHTILQNHEHNALWDTLQQIFMKNPHMIKRNKAGK